MKFFPFVLKHLRRNWVRTLSTVTAMAACIFLICTLQTVIRAINWGLQSANASRLVTRHSVSITFNLPVPYEEKIRQLPGVRGVAISNFFGGRLAAKREDASADTRGMSDFFPNMAVEAEPYLAMYPELVLPAEQKKAFMEDPRGCLIGPELARRYGWKVGDIFQLESFIPPYRRRQGAFEFVVRGVYHVDLARYPGTDDTMMLFHHKYLVEGTGRPIGAGSFVIQIDDPAQAGTISKQVDALFDNSEAQTLTETESAFRAGFIAMAGNLALLLNGIGLAVAFTILLVTANTMSMAMRERRTEIAVLKTLGFSSLLVMALLLGEALMLGVAGGGLGLLLTGGMLRVLPKLPMVGIVIRSAPDMGLPTAIGGLGFGVALALSLLAGFVPAWLAYRARITDMLRSA